MTAPAPAVQFNGQGSVNADQLNTYMQVCLNYAQMRTFSALGNMAIICLGQSSPMDGGGGFYYYNSTSTAPDNGSTIIVPTGNIMGAWLRESGFFTGNLSPTTVTTTPYTIPVTSGDTLVNVPTAASILLPLAASEINPLSIVDISGDASAHNITVVPNGSDRIVGQTSWIISQNYGAVTLFPLPGGGGWYIK